MEICSNMMVIVIAITPPITPPSCCVKTHAYQILIENLALLAMFTLVDDDDYNYDDHT